LEFALKELEVEVLKTAPGKQRQTDFFSKKEEEQEEFQSLISRLIDKMGMDRAFFASPVESYFPERSWRKSLEQPSSLTPSIPTRPLRILGHPRPLRKIENYFLATGKGRSKRWKAVEVEGPERLSGEWWFSDQERDYFTVQTESGERLWIFKTQAQEYFLHGIFD
jgi:protein ImuB